MNIRRKIRVSKSSRFILGRKFTSQNRLGSLIVGRKFLSVICRRFFTETRLENVDLTKTQPCKCFGYEQITAHLSK